jgi:hypothetical protein
LNYGTNSVRCLIVNIANDAEVAATVWGYSHGTAGVILSRDPNLARQHPADYFAGMTPQENRQPFWSYRSTTWAGYFLSVRTEHALRSRLEPMEKVARILRPMWTCC